MGTTRHFRSRDRRVSRASRPPARRTGCRWTRRGRRRRTPARPASARRRSARRRRLRRPDRWRSSRAAARRPAASGAPSISVTSGGGDVLERAGILGQALEVPGRGAQTTALVVEPPPELRMSSVSASRSRRSVTTSPWSARRVSSPARRASASASARACSSIDSASDRWRGGHATRLRRGCGRPRRGLRRWPPRRCARRG